LWSLIPGTKGLVMTAAFPTVRSGLRDPQAVREFELVMECTGAIRTLRAERNVPPGKRANAFVHSETGDEAFWEGQPGELLRLYAKLDSLRPLPPEGRPADAAALVVADQILYIPLEGLIDLEAEQARLDRDLDKVEKDLKRVEAKLDSAGFTEKAPTTVVEHERNKRVDLLSRRERIQGSLAELSRKSG